MAYEARQRIEEHRIARTPASIVAVINSEACLPFCSVCAEHCPIPNALRLESGSIVLDQDQCTGCGACVLVCPSPGMPIRLQPAKH